MTQDIRNHVESMIRDRRRLHARPEVGWTEFETASLVIGRLESLGWSVRCGLDVIDPGAVLGRSQDEAERALRRAIDAGADPAIIDRMQGYPAAVGILDTGRKGPTLALRFDMDALPIAEITQPGCGHAPADKGFASSIPGLMHACGHDAHTAIGLALAAWIADHANELRGRIKLIFQPAEEGTRGAAAMASAGVVDDADWFFAGHCGVTAQPGQMHIIRQGFLATTKFDVDFTGTPSHAGSNPEKGRSALIAAANAACMLTAIARTSEGDTRICVGRLEAGEGRNITPVHAHMECEVRGSTHAANSHMFDRAREVIAGAAAMIGVSYTITKTGEATVLERCDEAVEVLSAAADDAGLALTIKDSVGGSEDCTMLVRRVMQKGGKAGFFLWGCEHKGHHRPNFDVQDEQNMPAALAAMAAIVHRVCSL